MATADRARSRTTKAEQARATRRRIVAAAADLFVAEGFVSTTVAQIAASAGVAVQTLYLAFRNKTAILGATFDIAIAGDDEPVPIADREWFRQVLSEPDGGRAIEIFAAACQVIMTRTTPLYAVMRSAAADPEVADLLTHHKQLRYVSFGAVAKALTTKQGFAPSLTRARAADVLYTVISEDTFAMLVGERGWTVAAWRTWAVRAVRAELFPATASNDVAPSVAHSTSR